MKKLFFLSLIVTFSYIISGCTPDLTVHTPIKQIHSFTQAMDVLSQADEETLILFDIDYTVFVPESNLCWYKTKDWQRNKERYEPWLTELLDAAFTKMSKPELHYKSIWHTKEKPLLIEPSIVPLIKSLQNKRVKVLALTAITTGSYATIPSLPEWRFKKLKELDIDFSAADFDDIILHELTEKDGFYPALFKGIMCTGVDSKGKVLSTLLNRLQWKPKRIIFFDDTLSHVQDVVHEMSKHSIPCMGYECLGAYAMPCTLEKEVVELQLQHLIEHEDWITEEQAKALINGNKE